MKFHNESIIAQTPNKGFHKFKAFDPNDDDAEDMFLAIAMINAKVASGGKVTIPDNASDLKTFLKSYAANSKSTICSDHKIRDSFLEMVKYPLKTQYFNEIKYSPPARIFVAPQSPEKSAR